MGEAFHPSQTEINRQAQDVPTALNLDINQPIENNSLQATEAAKQTDESLCAKYITFKQAWGVK